MPEKNVAAATFNLKQWLLVLTTTIGRTHKIMGAVCASVVVSCSVCENFAIADPLQPSLTLQGALNEAVLHSPKISKSVATLKVAEARKLGANAAFLPSLSITDQAQSYNPLQGATSTVIAGALVSSTQGFYSNSVSANLNLNLYDGGKDVANYQSSVDAIRSAKFGLLATLNDVVFHVLTDYEAVATDQMAINAQHAIVVLAQDEVALMQQRLAAHFSSEIDLISSQQQLLQAMTKEIQGHQQLSSDRAKLMHDMGQVGAGPKEKRVEAFLPLAPLPTPRSIRSDPAVQSAYAELESSQEQVTAARAGYYPKVAFMGQYNMLGSDPSALGPAFSGTRGNNYSFGLSVTIPLLPAEDTESSVDEALAHVDESRSSYESTIAETSARLVAAEQNLQEAKQAYSLAKQSAELAANNERLVKARFLAQQISRLDLDQAKISTVQSGLVRSTTSLTLALASWNVYRSTSASHFFTAVMAAATQGADPTIGTK